MFVVVGRHFNNDVERPGHQNFVLLSVGFLILIRCLVRTWFRFDRGRRFGFQYLQVREHLLGGGGQIFPIELDAHVQVLRPDPVVLGHIEH